MQFSKDQFQSLQNFPQSEGYPNKVRGQTVAYVRDVYNQYFTSRRLAEVISDYFENMRVEIAGMKLTLNQNDEIILHLDKEDTELKKAKEDADQKVSDLKATIE